MKSHSIAIACIVLLFCGLTHAQSTDAAQDSSPQKAAALAPMPGGDEEKKITVDDVERTFLVHIPTGYDPKQHYPVVLLLHGREMDAEDMERLTRFNELADKDSIIAVYPSAARGRWELGIPVAQPSEYPGRRGGGRGGIIFGGPGMGGPGGRRGGGPGTQRRRPPEEHDDIAFFNQMLDSLSAMYSVDTTRIYATGLADGGFMDFRLGCRLADRIAAIAPVGAEMPKGLACLPERPVSVLMINGTSDPVMNYNDGNRAKENSPATLAADDSAKFWAKLDSCPSKPHKTTITPHEKGGMKTEVDTYDDCQQGAQVALYSIKGAGNTWPGGEQYMPEKEIGKTSNDLNADEVIWQFLVSRHLPKPPQS